MRDLLYYGWYDQPEYERYLAAMRLPCAACGAQPYQDCGTKRNADYRVANYGRQAGYADFSVASQDPDRQLAARQLWVAAHRQAAQRLADEVARTCPWCGKMYDTVTLMEEHERECE